MTSNPPGQGFQNKNRVAILAELDKEKRKLLMQNQSSTNHPGARVLQPLYQTYELPIMKTMDPCLSRSREERYTVDPRVMYRSGYVTFGLRTRHPQKCILLGFAACAEVLCRAVGIRRSGTSTYGLFSISLARSSFNKDFRDHAELQHIAAQQKAALQHAHAHSSGYFITQDSAFGNLILPVLPRLDLE